MPKKAMLHILEEISHIICTPLSSEEILQLTVEKLATYINVSRCSIVSIPEGCSKAEVVATFEDRSLKGLTIDLAKYPEIRKAVETRGVVMVEDVSGEPLLKDVQEELQTLGIRSLFVAPIMDKDRLFGTLFLRICKKEGHLTPQEVTLCRIVSNLISKVFSDKHYMEELIETNQELNRLNQLKTEYLSNVSHELRTPLSSIRGFAETSLRLKLPPEKQRECVEIIFKESERMERMVNQVLDISRISRGKLAEELVKKELDLTSELEAVVKLFTKSANKKSITMQERFGKEPLPLWADQDRIRQVIGNLLSNAIKFSHQGGTVYITTGKENQQVSFSIVDEGIGIPPSDLPYIFEKFYTVERGRARRFPGTGVGLFLVKEIVELHRGKIEVQSSLGKGSTFTVTLPAGRAAEGGQ